MLMCYISSLILIALRLSVTLYNYYNSLLDYFMLHLGHYSKKKEDLFFIYFISVYPGTAVGIFLSQSPKK